MPKLTGANGLVKSLLEAVEENQTPAIDVGEVKEYKQEQHLTTLNYGQTPPPDNTAPSVTVAVDEDTGATLNNKPIASPFAWQKCGLIVPIYPGMRALLAHNLGLTNDAIVAGFLWPENPTYEHPKNQPGDYWLCLPTELDANQQPTGKGVNDLTDKSGLRVIEAKGLQIFVGDNKLQAVGERPSVPDAQTIVIEHESGTKISIGNDGELEIKLASGKEMSIKSGNGSNAITVKDEGIELNANKISLTSTGELKISSSNIKSDVSGTEIR